MEMGGLFRLCLVSVLWTSAAVKGLTITRDDLHLSVVNVTRVMWEVKDTFIMNLTLHFKASTRPEVKWLPFIQSLENEIPDWAQTLQFEDGYGVATLTYPAQKWLQVKVGYFDAYFIQLRLEWNSTQPSHNNISMTLNTKPALISTGYDIAYTEDDPQFDVQLTIPREQAEGFRWAEFIPDYYLTEVRGYWYYPHINRVVSLTVYDSWPTMGRFLYVNKTVEEDTMTYVLNFTMGRQKADGVVEVASISEPDSDHLAHFITRMTEFSLLTVHNSSIAGPFPKGESMVILTHEGLGRSGLPTYCHRECTVGCKAVANYITSVTIFKAEADGTQTPVPGVRYVQRNSHVVNDVWVDVHQKGDYAGTYVCQARSRDGSTGNATFEIV